MNDDELDDRIRALMSSAMIDAPEPKPLPARAALSASSDQSVVVPFRRRRMIVWTAVGVAASLVVGFVVFRSATDDNQRVTAATSSSVGGSVSWPADLAVIVAGERGVEKVGTAGEATKLLDTAGIARAYELADGSLIYQKGTLTDGTVVGGGDIVWRSADGSETSSLVTAGDTQLQLFDASRVDGDLGLLQLVYGDVGSDGPTVDAWFQPDEPHAWVPEGGWAVGYRRWMIAGDDRVLAGWTDDTLQSGATMRTTTGDVVNVGDRFAGALSVVAAPDGRTGRLDDDGVLTLFDPNGAVSTVDVPNAQDGVDLQLRGAALVVNYATSRSAVLIDLRDGAMYEVPVAGYATPSMADSAEAPPVSPLAFPAGEVRAVVTQRDSDGAGGAWIVTDDEFVQVDATAGGPAFLAGDTLVFSPKNGGVVALDRATGSMETLRASGQVVDAAILGGELYYLYTDYSVGIFISLYLHGPSGDVYIAPDMGSDTGHLSWHLGRDVIVGTGAYYSSMRPEFYDFAGNSLTGLSDQFAPATQPPQGNRMLYTMSAEGLWGIADGDVLTLRQWGDPAVLDTIAVPDGATATRLDVSADRIIVTYNLGTNGADAAREATRDGDGTWTWSDLPGSGWATMPRAVDPGAPPAVTPLTEPPYVPGVALAGSDGVRLIIGDGTTTTITTDPAERVLLRRDGSVSFYSPGFGAYPHGWNPVTGEISEHWAGTNYVAQPILHDDLGALAGSPFGDFLFSVADQVYRNSDERGWPAPGAADTRLSCSYDGWVVGNGVRFAMGDSQPPEWLGTAGGEWALTPDGSLAASTTDGLIRVRRTSDGVVVYEQPIGNRTISEVDVSGEWLGYIETPGDTPAADATSRAVLVHLPSGRSITYDDVASLSLANTDL